jgi:hypothetical protein
MESPAATPAGSRRLGVLFKNSESGPAAGAHDSRQDKSISTARARENPAVQVDQQAVFPSHNIYTDVTTRRRVLRLVVGKNNAVGYEQL